MVCIPAMTVFIFEVVFIFEIVFIVEVVFISEVVFIFVIVIILQVILGGIWDQSHIPPQITYGINPIGLL